MFVIFEIDQLLVIDMKLKAEMGIFDGRGISSYLGLCMQRCERTGTSLLYSRDEGYHSGGWWKNPDYERCYHLSLSFFDWLSFEPRPKDTALTAKWISAFFGSHSQWLWCEPPSMDLEIGAWHYRLFCDPKWQPIKPRGEVYSTQFTELGWKSFSELSIDVGGAGEFTNSDI